MKPGKLLARRTELKRTGFLRQQSKKRQKANKERRAIVREAFGDQPECVVPSCGRLADDVHEPLTRARGGSIVDRDNMAPLSPLPSRRDHVRGARLGVRPRAARPFVGQGRCRMSATHVVQYSTGAGSAEVAWRVVDQHGAANVVLLTADTRVEDDDNWRFAHEVHGRLGRSWVILADGRTPMEVGRANSVVPNNRMAVCSRILKRELLRSYIDEHFEPDDTVIYLGYDWSEDHRIKAAWPQWDPYKVAAPLADPPYMSKPDLLNLFRSRGIEPPRLYAQGFAHANCGGACVRGGQAQWELLLRVNPTRYKEWEDDEQQSRDLLGKDVAILRDRRGGTTKPMTLRSFRERLSQPEQDGMFDPDDWGACGCFTAEEEPA